MNSSKSSTTLKPYPKYKDSGVEWLGKVPEQWKIRRTKTVLSQRNVKGFHKEPLLAATQTKGVVKKEKYENRTVVAQNDLQNLKLVKKDDFVISLRSFQGGIEKSYDQGIISPAYTVLQVKDKKNLDYLTILFKSNPYIDNLKLYVTGIREGQNIDYEKLSRSYLLLPTNDEQSLIVRYLNYTYSRINKYIAAKKKLIKLLEEQKQAIIHQAVTGAIDVRTGKPYPKYKESGVEWLGKVPEGWEVKKLKTVAKMLVSNVDKHINEGELPARLCNYVDIYKNERITSDFEFMKATVTFEELKKFKLKVDDVIITKDSEVWTDIGVPAIAEYEASDLVCGYHLAIIRPYENLIAGEYILRLLQDKLIATQLHILATGVTRYGLSHYDIKSILLLVPSLDEQLLIIIFVKEELSKIDESIILAKKEIELLEEYRTRLTADVVTGKVDVREVARDLPDEVSDEELGVLDESEGLEEGDERVLDNEVEE